MNDKKRIMEAVFFAATKHQDQRRKSEGDIPYVNHVLQVGNILAEDGQTTDVIIAGILHDVVEDTDCTFEELEAKFGANICGIVREVSDDKSLSKAERKQMQIDKAPYKSVGAKAIKIADKLANLGDLKANPPVDWSAERCEEYFVWSQKVIDALRGSHPSLEQLFDETLNK